MKLPLHFSVTYTDWMKTNLLSNYLRQLCYRDDSVHPPGVIVFLRWVKNLQRTSQSHTFCLPRMSQELLCPVRAFNCLLSQHHSPLDPVINVNRVPLTNLYAHLRCRLSASTILSHALTYHSLRRSGASLAFNNNVDFHFIRSQGAWTSDSVCQNLFSASDRVNEDVLETRKYHVVFGACFSIHVILCQFALYCKVLYYVLLPVY